MSKKVGSSPVSLKVHRDESERRKVDLESYLAENVWNSDQGFICLSGKVCRRSAHRQPGVGFYEAQGHMVGPCYDLEADGRPFRVLIIPMETVTKHQHTTVKRRTEAVLRAIHGPRDAQMRGVMFALRLAFGIPYRALDKEHIDFDNDDTPAHLFESFAMTNLLLCSAVVKETKSSRSTGMMRGSCSRHMRATIGILQPTLVISQGVRLDETLRASLGVTHPINEHVAACDLDGNSFAWVSLRHPTRNWNSVNQPYLKAVVAPAITQAREIALAEDW